MRKLPTETIQAILALRKIGKSIPEICKEINVGKTTVQRYVKGVSIPDEYSEILREKQGGSKDRALAVREHIYSKAEAELQELSLRDSLILLVGLYWGEGTKRDFGIVNSDPRLIQSFIYCLSKIGIPKDRLSMSLRMHSDIPIEAAKQFWSKATGISIETIGKIEIIEGKKKGKLPYGMCRIRVCSGIKERLYIQSLIQIIGKEADKRLVSS